MLLSNAMRTLKAPTRLGLRAYDDARPAIQRIYCTRKITREDWHSECTNSCDMFVFLLFSFFFHLLLLLFLLTVFVFCSFEGTYNGSWYTVTGPDVYVFLTVKYTMVFFLYYRVFL